MSVRIYSGSHRCEVEAGPWAEVTVVGDAQLDLGPGGHEIDDVRSRIRVRVPEGTDLVVGSSSGRVEITGRCGAVSVTSSSGKVQVAAATAVDARTDSGRIEIGAVDSECRVHTRSGRVEVERCGSADVAAESSRIELDAVHGPARAHTVSGRVQVGMAEAADVDAETDTGRIEVALPRGTVVHRPAPGSEAPLPDDADCTVLARSTPGKVEIRTG